MNAIRIFKPHGRRAKYCCRQLPGPFGLASTVNNTFCCDKERGKVWAQGEGRFPPFKKILTWCHSSPKEFDRIYGGNGPKMINLKTIFIFFKRENFPQPECCSSLRHWCERLIRRGLG